MKKIAIIGIVVLLLLTAFTIECTATTGKDSIIPVDNSEEHEDSNDDDSNSNGVDGNSNGIKPEVPEQIKPGKEPEYRDPSYKPPEQELLKWHWKWLDWL